MAMEGQEVARPAGTNVRREDAPGDGDFLSRETLRVLGMFLLYSTSMFTLPFAAFFGTRHVLVNTYGMEGFAVNASSVFASVLMVNVIIVFYAYQAYREDVAEQRSVRGRSQLNVKED